MSELPTDTCVGITRFDVVSRHRAGTLVFSKQILALVVTRSSAIVRVTLVHI